MKIICPYCKTEYIFDWGCKGIWLNQIVYSAFCKKCNGNFDITISIKNDDDNKDKFKIKTNKISDDNYIG
jgi:hypothetical protein